MDPTTAYYVGSGLWALGVILVCWGFKPKSKIEWTSVIVLMGVIIWLTKKPVFKTIDWSIDQISSVSGSNKAKNE